MNSRYRVVHVKTTNNATETCNPQLSDKIITLYNLRTIQLPTSGRNYRQVFLWYLEATQNGIKMGTSKWEMQVIRSPREELSVVVRVVGRCRFSNGYRRLEWTICLHHQVSKTTLGAAPSSVTMSHISMLTTKSETDELYRNEPASGRKKQTWT